MLKQTQRASMIKAKNKSEEEELSPEEVMNLFKKLQEDPDGEELQDRGIILINDYISKENLDKVYKRLLVLHLNKDYKDDIQIIINSPGGYCDAGWALIDLMDFIKNRVITIAMGDICSMATCIFIAGNERIMAPNASAMIHQYSGGTSGNYSALVADRKIQDLEQEKDIRLLIRCSKYKTKEEVEKHILKPTDNWLSPQEMKKHGLCDKIYVPKKLK